MKFSLINASPNEDVSERERKLAIAAFPPLGVLYLATILRERGIDVSVMDQPGKGATAEETVDWVRREDPDILGFSTFAMSGRTAALISRKVKDENPNITTVFGGFYATFNAERVLRKYPQVDIVVRGEGEDIVVDLVNCLNREGHPKNVSGITFREGNRIASTPDRPLIKDLDSLPFPDRSMLDVDYHSNILGANIAVKKFTSIVSSRGCVHKCGFCSCQNFARGVWRPRSIKNTLEELHYLWSEGYRQLIFVDDSFTLNQKRAVELCRRMRRERLDMEWICEGRVDSCSYEMLREIASAGCKVMYFGIESANQRILDYYGKRTTPEQSERAVELARKAGIDVIIGSFIVGGPDETREEIRHTIEFAKKIPIDLPQINILGVYPGMAIWNELRQKGFLDENLHWETGALVSDICPDAVPLEEIKRMTHNAFYDFIRRPGFVLRQVARTFGSSYRMQMMVKNLSRLGSIRESLRSFA